MPELWAPAVKALGNSNEGDVTKTGIKSQYDNEQKMGNSNMQPLLDEYKKTELKARMMGEAIDNQSGRPSRESQQALDAVEQQARQLRLQIREYQGGEEAILDIDIAIASQLKRSRQ